MIAAVRAADTAAVVSTLAAAGAWALKLASAAVAAGLG